MAPRKPKTVPPLDLDDIIGQVYGTTTTVPSAPSTTLPSTTSTTVPSTTTPVSRQLRDAENRLRSTAREAERLGISTTDYYTPSQTTGTTSLTGNPAIDAIIANSNKTNKVLPHTF